VLKDELNREEELRALGWPADDLRRYADLWEYRKRWGAANLEREERLFLRKADRALPALATLRKGAGTAKQVEQKAHYLWLELYRNAMEMALGAHSLEAAEELAWVIVLDEELRVLRELRPRLDLKDTTRRRELIPHQQSWIDEAAKQGRLLELDLAPPLATLRQQQGADWSPLWDRPDRLQAKSFPLLTGEQAAAFRQRVGTETERLTKEIYPSLQQSP
jgi:hypothetical protein